MTGEPGDLADDLPHRRVGSPNAVGTDSSTIRRDFGPPARPRVRRGKRSLTAPVVVAGVVLSALAAGAPWERLNRQGWPQLRRFLAAAAHPVLTGDFLALVWREALVTVSYAVLGTALALVLGLAGGLVLCRRWWWRPGGGGAGRAWWLLRAVAALPRAVHEVVWGLLLLNVLGLDPWVAVLAIGIPFGAITAKVFADAIDDAAAPAHQALRLAGAGRLAAIAYAVLPDVRDDLISYGFYRFECAIRSAAILGMVGAGGLGFQLTLSFTSLRYGEVWTILWALVIVNGLADAWSGRVRRRAPTALAPDGTRTRRLDSRSAARATGVVLVPAVVLAWWWVDLDPSRLWSERARSEAGYLAGELLPPSFPGGVGHLAGQALNTIALSVLAMAIAAAVGAVVALVVGGALGPGGPAGALVRAFGRGGLLVARAVPPPVWAIVVLFVLRPGAWAGAVALGAYNAGVLGRLLAEAVEAADHRPAGALRAAGATRLQTVAYAFVPTVAGRFGSLTLYRWEVAIRETVVVGVVGAGGLGRVLDDALTAFAWDEVAGVIVALAVVTFAVDAASTRLRRRAW